MKYLITGGAGFIGSHLAEHLIARGDKVTILDNRSPAYRVPKAYYVQGCVMDDTVVDPLVKSHDATFHLAAVVGFANVMADPALTISTSIYGSGIVLNSAYEHGKRVLFTSTSACYGKTVNGGEPVSETAPATFGPTSISSWSYAYAKAVDECLALAYRKSHGAAVIIARVFNTVGPRQSADAGFVLPRFVQRALAGEPLEVHSPGTQTRTFCHVKDTVQGLASLMECDKALGEIVNIGGTETIGIWELAQKVRAFTESRSTIKLVEQPYGPGYENVEDRKPNLDKAWTLFRYLPRYGLEDMIRDVVEEHMERMVA